MFNVTGNVSLPAGMTLSIVPGLEETVDLINCFGTLNSSGTVWTIDANRPAMWSVKTTQNAIRAKYSKPCMMVILR